MEESLACISKFQLVLEEEIQRLKRFERRLRNPLIKVSHVNAYSPSNPDTSVEKGLHTLSDQMSWESSSPKQNTKRKLTWSPELAHKGTQAGHRLPRRLSLIEKFELYESRPDLDLSGLIGKVKLLEQVSGINVMQKKSSSIETKKVTDIKPSKENRIPKVKTILLRKSLNSPPLD